MANGKALIKAAEEGDEAGLRALLAGGADPDEGAGAPVDTARRRRTALMAACERGHAGCARALLEAGASTRYQDKRGRDAMAWAIEGGRSSDERPERVCDKGEGASKSALACVRLLLARPGAVADKESGKGHDKSTPLARAVSWLDDECVEELLAAGADPNKLSMIHVSWLTNAALCIGNQMNTPLASAISRGDAALFGRLLAAGADPNLKALWSPSVEEIAERCRHAGSEAPALVRSAKAAWAARQEARAIEEAAEPGSASARAPRM